MAYRSPSQLVFSPPARPSCGQIHTIHFICQRPVVSLCTPHAAGTGVSSCLPGSLTPWRPPFGRLILSRPPRLWLSWSSSCCIPVPSEAGVSQDWVSRPISLLSWRSFLLNTTLFQLLPLTLNLDVQLLKVIPTSANSTPTQTAPHTASPTSGSGTITHTQNPRSFFSLLFHRSKSSQGTGFPPGPPTPNTSQAILLSRITSLSFLPFPLLPSCLSIAPHVAATVCSHKCH